MCLFFVTFRLEKKRTFRIKSSGNCKKNQWISQCIVGLYGPPSLSSTRYSKIPEKKVHFREIYMTHFFVVFTPQKGIFPLKRNVWKEGKIFFKRYLIILQSLLTAYFYLFFYLSLSIYFEQLCSLRFSHYFVVFVHSYFFHSNTHYLLYI